MKPLEYAPEVITVTPPGCDDVHLRSPTFADWHAVATAHRALAAERKDPPADLIAKTIAVCLCDKAGKPLADQQKILRAGHRQIMWIYARCWETVLKAGDEVVAEHEKNSEASRG
jgi:hypothetical protein